MNFDWITRSLAVGGRVELEDYPRLADPCRITGVIDLRSDRCDDEKALRDLGIRYLSLPTEDLCEVPHDLLSRGVNWASEIIRRDRRVWVHCEHGIGRSATLACCVLVNEGHTLRDSLELLKTRRQVVSPSPEQLNGLINWVAQRFGDSPSWEELSEIAYRFQRL